MLEEIGGRPALRLELDRLRGAKELDEIVVATSEDPSDNPVAALAEDAGVAVVRGPLDDVLARFDLAAELHPGRAIARLTGDCPLIDPAVVDAVVCPLPRRRGPRLRGRT